MIIWCYFYETCWHLLTMMNWTISLIKFQQFKCKFYHLLIYLSSSTNQLKLILEIFSHEIINKLITSFIAHFCLPLMKLFWTHSDISYLILIPQVFIYHSINMHISNGVLIYLTVLSIRRISLNIGWGDLLIHNFLKLEISNSPLSNVISNNFSI